MHWQPQGVSPDVARQGKDGHCAARLGAAWRGKARQSTDGQGLQTAVRRASAFPTALSGADAARPGSLRPGMARTGRARTGKARTARRRFD